ncbi:MAG: hypothetical protein Q8S13_03505, partial [Dehalococcoidia bacterium]|nr:hypothetical protein [Dehalococcoidia bacterium]
HWRLRIGRRTIYFDAQELAALRRVLCLPSETRALLEAQQEISILRAKLRRDELRGHRQFGGGA